MKSASAAILSTGTEILQGHYPDMNAQYLAAKLTRLGIEVRSQMAAPDRAEDVAGVLASLVERYDLVFMTGGLGPTEDDVTRQAVCAVFQTDLAEDPKAWEMIVRRFALRGGTPSPSNRVQVLIPRGARTLYNKWGTAPGFVLEPPLHGATQKSRRRIKTGAVRCRFFAALPGPPRENHPMFEEYLEHEIATRFGDGVMTRIATLHTFGIPESALNDLLLPLFKEYRDSPTVNLAFLAGEARVDVRMTVRAGTKQQIALETRHLLRKIRGRMPKGCVYGVDEDTLESVVSRLLRRKGLKLAVAESCTGGLVAKRLTDLAGSSDIFLEGWVTYSNTAKRKRLGVAASTLQNHGAVSAETAREMALGALRASGADIAVSLTGIAGPTGGTPQKPVGLVWYGLAWKAPLQQSTGVGSRKMRVETFRTCFPSGREMVRLYASHRALDLVRRLLLNLPFACPND